MKNFYFAIILIGEGFFQKKTNKYKQSNYKTLKIKKISNFKCVNEMISHNSQIGSKIIKI